MFGNPEQRKILDQIEQRIPDDIGCTALGNVAKSEFMGFDDWWMASDL